MKAWLRYVNMGSFAAYSDVWAYLLRPPMLFTMCLKGNEIMVASTNMLRHCVANNGCPADVQRTDCSIS